MNILFTICGRAGSKGFKNKNLKMFNGVPLVYYSLAAIELFSRKNRDQYDIDIVVNTDSRELIDITKKQRVIEINVINRDESLAGDKVPKETVIKDCLIKMIDKKNKSYDMVIDLDITSPLRTVKDIENNTEYDYIVINDIVSYAVSDICTILDAEKQKTFRCKNIISEVISNA